jgi:superfamily II RNA helicase
LNSSVCSSPFDFFFAIGKQALINQVYAEIVTKFQVRAGIFTGDDKIHVMDARVLVTLPVTFEILLLSHTAMNWKKKIKYVILDEIHCINEKSVGSYWEHVCNQIFTLLGFLFFSFFLISFFFFSFLDQILLMISCPFIGLSATIGNPHEFRDWLNITKKNVELVEYKNRPRPLEYLVYNPKNREFVELHPLAALNEDFINIHDFQNVLLSHKSSSLSHIFLCFLLADATNVSNSMFGSVGSIIGDCEILQDGKPPP